MASSPRNQISSLQGTIDDNSELQDGVVFELKSCKAINPSPDNVEGIIQCHVDTDKHDWTYIGDISDDGSFIHDQVLFNS